MVDLVKITNSRIYKFKANNLINSIFLSDILLQWTFNFLDQLSNYSKLKKFCVQWILMKPWCLKAWCIYLRAWSVVAEDPFSGQFLHPQFFGATAAATSATEGDGGLQGTTWLHGTAGAVGRFTEYITVCFVQSQILM